MAGPMGRPEFLGSRVGDRNTERAEARPVPGTAPNRLSRTCKWGFLNGVLITCFGRGRMTLKLKKSGTHCSPLY